MDGGGGALAEAVERLCVVMVCCGAALKHESVSWVRNRSTLRELRKRLFGLSGQESDDVALHRE